MLVFVSAAVGVTDPFRNLAPTWIYIVFWLGLPLLSVLFGNVWRALSPLARARGCVRVGAESEAARQPRRSPSIRAGGGRWPAAGLLFAFAALELAYTEPASPRALALAIALYTYITSSMAAFGREPWTRNGEAFAVLFGFFALISPWVAADGRLRSGSRSPASRCVTRHPAPSRSSQ